jgi:excisionase family DNA binding protein
MNKTVFISLPIEDLQTVIIDCVNSCLRNNKQEPIPTDKSEQPLTVEETAKFLKLSVPTIYGLVHKKKLIGMKPSKHRYFHKIELLDYLNQGRKKTCDEISIENDKFLTNSKKRK